MAASKRVIWKGAISFGLVNIPVAVHLNCCAAACRPGKKIRLPNRLP